MKKFYTEFFHIPKHGKIHEKVMLARVGMTVAVILACLAAMSITAYAYFSYTVSSSSSAIKASRFEADVLVQLTDQNGAEVPVTIVDNQTYSVALEANTPYYVTLSLAENNSAETGFLILTAEHCEDKYHTQQLGKDGGAVTESISFSIRANADTKISLLAHWGTSSYYRDGSTDNPLYIENGDPVELTVKGATTTTTITTTTTTASTSTEQTAASTTTTTAASTALSTTTASVTTTTETVSVKTVSLGTTAPSTAHTTVASTTSSVTEGTTTESTSAEVQETTQAETTTGETEALTTVSTTESTTTTVSSTEVAQTGESTVETTSTTVSSESTTTVTDTDNME